MKKYTFIIAALFAAAFANAQITLEHTFNGALDGVPMIDQDVFGDFYVLRDKTTNEINVYDANTYNVVWTFSTPNASATLYSKNFFTTDGKFACLIRVYDYSKTDNTRCHFYIYDENYSVIADLGTAYDAEYVRFVKLSTGYKLMIEKVDSDFHFSTAIYSLPGNGEDIINTPSSPKRSAARKIARDGQVLVETPTNMYDLRGQEVK